MQGAYDLKSYHIKGFLLLVEKLKSIQTRTHVTFCKNKR